MAGGYHRTAKQKCVKPLLQSEVVKIAKRHLLLGVILGVSLLVASPMASAGSTSQPYNVHVTKNYVQATARCSCGDGTWNYKTMSFVNYCPYCHRYGTLHYSKYCDEGQWTCSHCDSDFCMQCGKEKMPGTALWLRPYIVKSQVKAVSTVNSTVNCTKKTNSTNVTEGNIGNVSRVVFDDTNKNSWMETCRQVVRDNIKRELWALV